MMFALLAALAAVPGADEAALIGSWRLVETRETLADATTRPNARYGAHGRGLLIYAADHHMCAFLDNPDRRFPPPPNPDPVNDFPAAYCGTWTIDTAQHRITHLVTEDVVPAAAGSQRVRSYSFSGDALILRPVPLGQGLRDYYLRFERAR